MSWIENLREASFRGAPFYVDERRMGAGRRTNLHEYPQRDIPYSEDLGRRAHTFTLTAYVVGVDYMEARDVLLEAVDQAGPGELIDPWGVGVLRVACVRCELRESFREGAFASFALTFEEAGENVAPAATRDTRTLVGSAGTSAVQAARDAFETVYSVVGLGGYLSTRAQAVLEVLADGLDAAEERARTGATPNGEAFRDLASFRAAIPEISREPAQLAEDLSSLTADVAALEEDPERRVERMLDLAAVGDDLDAEPTTTPGRIQAGANQAALLSVLRRAAIAEAAAAVASIAFTSYEHAQAVRDAVLDVLEAELLAAGELATDDAYLELRGLYAAVAEDVAARSATLARVTEYTPAGTEPALAIAQRLYGDATRDAELIARNSIAHPGFTPGGVPLEVLTDG